MIKKYVFVYCFLIVHLIFGQQTQDSTLLKEDLQEAVDLRTFDEDLREKYTDNAFNYETKDGEAQNLLSRAIRWILEGLSNIFGIHIPPNIGAILEYVIYILMGVFALYLLIKFFVGENVAAIFTKSAKPFIDLGLEEQHIEHLDLDQHINDALAQQNYRLAIRYQYLKGLKLLSQKNIIEWHYEKTNNDYQNEITKPTLGSIFKEVSYIYDHIWYGEQPVDEIKYKASALRFMALQNSINGDNG